MLIKDVEKKTGLSAKTIRYYEQKGLLDIKRNEENDYRIYEDKDIERLQLIKILRYLDFSIDNICNMIDKDEEYIKECLIKQLNQFNHKQDKINEQQALCKDLIKNYHHHIDLNQYDEMIHFIESDEYKEFVEALNEYSTLSTVQFIIYSLICLGPILSLFIHIILKNYSALLLNGILAIIATILLVLHVQNFIKNYKYNKKKVKEKNKYSLSALPIIVLTLFLSFLSYYFMYLFYEYIILPKDYLFYETSQLSMFICIILVVLLSGMVSSEIVCKVFKYDRNEIEKQNDFIAFSQILGRYKYIFMILSLGVILGLLCNVSVVTSDSIIDYDLFDLSKDVYSYHDIEKIETGFGQNSFGFVEYKKKGNFYYKLYIQGKEIVFSQPSVNEDIKEYEDSYIELEYFDQSLMDLGIEKTGSIKGYEHVIMDDIYVQRFIRIIENKGTSH